MINEYNARTETEQLLADLKDKEAVAREMIAILRGVRGRDARYDRKAALKVLAKVKQKRVLAEHGLLRRSQDRLGYLEAQSAKVNRANIKKAHDSRMNAERIYVNLPPPTESLPITAKDDSSGLKSGSCEFQ